LLFFRGFGARYRVNKEEQKSMDAFNGLFWASVALMAAWLVMGFVTGKFFWAMWFLVLLAPFCQVRFLGQMFAERYIYPAAVGICAVLAFLPSPWYWILVGLYVMRTHMFIPVFESGRKMYENGIAREPNDGQSYCNMSDWYLCIEPDFTLAGYYIQKHIALDPIDYKGYVNFASLWRRLKNYPNAMDNIKKAKELAEGCASPHIHSVIDRQILWIGLELAGKSAGLTKEEFDEHTKKQAAAV
jgi:tetratricopeptide (TPR) repeat protein